MDRDTAPALAQPLVGREQQLALLGEVFAGAAAGRPTVVLIQGDAGMGKSALLARSTAEFEAGGAVLLRAAGDEAESALPLGSSASSSPESRRGRPCSPGSAPQLNSTR